MKLVVDTSILFSFFRENPVRFIIINSEAIGLQLFSPAYVLEELDNNMQDLIKYSKLSRSEISPIIEELKKFIFISPSSEYKEFESKAKQLIHDKDIPIFALALKLNCAIWSNEPGFKKQSSVKIFNTGDLRELLAL